MSNQTLTMSPARTYDYLALAKLQEKKARQTLNPYR